MPVTFNTPPTWPSPPAGFLPPHGWQPDPTWGPAPAGWVFYLDNGAPVPTPLGSWQPPVTRQGFTPPMSSAGSATPPQQAAPPQSMAPPQPPTFQPAPQGTPPPQSPTYSAGPSYAATPQGPGFGPPSTAGAPDPLYAQGGYQPGMPGAPAPKKSKTGLIIGIAVGGVVLLAGIGLVIALLFFTNNGPQLTSAQFDTVFAEGDAALDATIAERETFDVTTGTAGDDACEEASLDFFQTGSEAFTALTFDTYDYSADLAMYAGVRFDDVGSASSAYDTAADTCSSANAGVVNGARWFAVGFVDEYAFTTSVLVQYGNTGILGVSSSATEQELASAIQEEVDEASRS